MLKIIHIKEAFRMFRRRLKAERSGIKQYKGTSIKICTKILGDCYNKKHNYFQVSNGHFCEFYSRDFGWICKSLLELGYKEKVRSTLDYALSRFAKYRKITASISPNGTAFDFPNYAVDSLAYILYCLALLNDKKLVRKYRLLLEEEILYLQNFVIDKSSKTGKTSGLVRKDRFFSSMKDYSKRNSSCYDNCMLFLIQQSCNKLGLVNPLKQYNYKQLIIKHFWTGSYFLDDLSGKKYVAGDANLFPFWTGLITDRSMLKKVIKTIQEHQLDQPFPLRYTDEENREINMKSIEFFAKDYERHVVWTHMGLLYIDIVGRIDKKLQKKHLLEYKNIINKYKNFLEVFYPDSTPYRSFFYYSDEAMSWCASYLSLAKKLRIRD